MKFDCKEIDISDDEFGCRITFSDRKEGDHIDNQSYKEIMESIGDYLTLQRSYPEDEFETDYYIIELSNFDKSGELDDFTINLSRTQFLMNYKEEIIEIQLETNDLIFDKIKEALKKIINERGQININE